MVLTALPLAGLTAFAAETTGGDFAYEVLSEADKTCAITDYTGEAIELEIPSELDGYTVTRIGDFAFSPEASYEEACDKIVCITVPSSVTSIGSGAFENCTSLRNIMLGTGVTSLEDFAFSGCTSLTDIIIPSSVKSLGWRVFCGCTSLTNISIPSSVTSMGGYVFDGCSALVSITVDEGNPAYSSDENGVLFDKNKTVLLQYPIGRTDKTYIVPNNVICVGESAFCWNTAITTVVLPDGVTSLGIGAFSECPSLTTIIIPRSVSSIDEFTFIGSDLLTIHGYAGSYAETYAVEHDIPFVTLQSTGDISNDGTVDAVDARWVLQAAAGMRTLENAAAADVNGDSTIDAVDARWILQAAAGMRTL